MSRELDEKIYPLFFGSCSLVSNMHLSLFQLLPSRFLLLFLLVNSPYASTFCLDYYLSCSQMCWPIKLCLTLRNFMYFILYQLVSPIFIHNPRPDNPRRFYNTFAGHTHTYTIIDLQFT